MLRGRGGLRRGRGKRAGRVEGGRGNTEKGAVEPPEQVGDRKFYLK